MYVHICLYTSGHTDHRQREHSHTYKQHWWSCSVSTPAEQDGDPLVWTYIICICRQCGSLQQLGSNTHSTQYLSLDPSLPSCWPLNIWVPEAKDPFQLVPSLKHPIKHPSLTSHSQLCAIPRCSSPVRCPMHLDNLLAQNILQTWFILMGFMSGSWGWSCSGKNSWEEQLFWEEVLRRIQTSCPFLQVSL